ncbi:TonB-dependent receptor [Flavobacteriaceae bacterium]|nr:TonB-dependent receptor [Flavobacteriaceae bacterium]
MKTILKKFLTLSFMIMFQWGLAQTSVSGTVSDSSGVPLPGATVVVAGTSNGVTTDFDGVYSISASEGDVLSISYVGFITQNVTVGASASVNVTLVSDNTLEEVVVTALGITREAKSLGYAQQKVEGASLTKTKELDFKTALAGKVAGVQVISGTSSSFEQSAIRLRGEMDVLYVVDGIKMSSTDVNTDNIDNITILKGAAATALYGAEARSGVIVITSKKAKAGETYISIDHNTVASNVSRTPDYQNEYGGGYYQDWDTFAYNPATDPASWASFNGQNIPYYAADESWGPKMDGTLARHWDSWIPNHPNFGEQRGWSPSPNNVKNFFDTGVKSTTSVSFAKGGDDYSFRATGRVNQSTLPIPNASRDSYDLNINGSLDLTDKLSVYTSLNARIQNTDNSAGSGYGSIMSNLSQWWQRQLDMDRIRDNYNYEGAFYTWNRRSARNARPQYWDAPHYEQYQNTNNNENSTYSGNFGFDYQIADGLSANAEVNRRAYNRTNNGRNYIGQNTLSTQAAYNEGSFVSEQNEFRARLNYTKAITDKFDISALIGYQAKQYRSINTSASTSGGLAIPDFYTIANSVDKPNYSSYRTNNSGRAAYSSVSLGYDSMLYLDGSYRFDWSSTAAADNNRIETYSITGSFLFDRLVNLEGVSFGKLRASYAEAPIFPGTYVTSPTFGSGTAYGSLASLAVPNTLSNPMLTGGIRQETEFGLEMKFLSNRLGFDLTYFDREDSGLPVAVSAAGSTGYTGLSVNSKITSSTGFEVMLSGTPIQTEDLRWNVAVNFATLEKMVDFIYPGIERNILSSWLSWSSMDLQEIVGEEWGMLYGRKRKTDAQGNWIYQAGGNHDYENNQLLGNIMPDYTGGITSNLTYKNWDLAIGIDFQEGGLYHSVTDMFSMASGQHSWTAGLNDKGNPKRDAVSAGGGVHQVGVYADGSAADFYRAPDSWAWGNWTRDDLWLVDASFWKLRQVRLGYTFDKDQIKNSPFASIDIALIGTNLAILSENKDWGDYRGAKNPGLDPSELGGNWSGNNFASEGGQLPSARSFGLNVALKF